jgi:hypothetical protein
MNIEYDLILDCFGDMFFPTALRKSRITQNNSQILPAFCVFFVYRIPSLFWAALGPFLQTLQDQIQAEEFEFDAAWTDLMG